MDMRDGDTLYFYLFPGKKQYIKRLIGKPGDTLFFYGGMIYGIDQNGNDISYEFQSPECSSIDHIPFIRFDGNPTYLGLTDGNIIAPIILSQTGEPVAKLSVNSLHQPVGEMLASGNQPPVPDYGDLWGFNNYAMARLLTREQVKYFSGKDPSSFGDGILYLESVITRALNLQSFYAMKQDITGLF